MRRGRGFIPDPARVAKALANAIDVEPQGSPPSVASLIQWAPKHFDQGMTGSCTMHACSGALMTSFAKIGSPLPFVPSPAEGYRLARAIDRAFEIEAGAPLPPLRDIGASPSQVMRAITKWGLYKIGKLAGDGRYSDAEPETIDEEPTLDILESVQVQIESDEYYAINTIGPRRVRDMQRAIANGHAVCFAVFVDDDFEAWDPGPGVPLSTPNRGDPNGGLHYMYVIGFRTLKSGRVVFRFRNSWGTGWGMAGDGEGDELFTAGMSDIRVMAPKPRNWPKGIV